MPSAVHIALSDRGWILEHLAKEISARLPYVSYDTTPDPDAIIQYYPGFTGWHCRFLEPEVDFLFISTSWEV